MAQNVTINGVAYPDVPAIELPKTGGGTARFIDENDVPTDSEPVVQPLEITENGTYTAPDGVDGYSPVTVNVASGGGDTDIEDSIVNRSISGAYVNDRITSIGQYAFRGCTKITSFSFPNVKSVGSNAFYGATAPTVDLPACTKLADNVFTAAKGVTSINVPVLTTLSGTYTFRDCEALEFLDFPALTAIKASTFYSSGKLATIVLRKSDAIVSLANTSAFTSTPFASSGTGGKVYVPAALIEEYQAATNWSTLYAAGNCEFVAIEGSEYE